MRNCSHCGSSNPDDALFCGDCGKKLGSGTDASGLDTLSGLATVDSIAPSQGRSDEADLEAGAEFGGRYRIEAVIGRGGMGTVYRAHDKLVDKVIALKLIRRDRLSGEAAVKKLISEGVLTRDIRHENVVAVYDVGEAEQRPFVSMEYIDGNSLRSWLRKHGQDGTDVPLAVAARIVMEILAGLEAAHAKGVIHRDLKPENIILVAEPDKARAPLKILDFGIARAAGAAAESSTGTGIGTPRYMAPEQITNPDAAGPPADFYSISVIFYEMLVGVLPQGHWQPPSGGRSDIPAAIDKLIEAGLSNRAASRPQSTADYRTRLVEAMNGYAPPRVVGGNGTLPPATDEARKLPLKWIGVGAGVVATLAVIAGSVGGGDVESDDFTNRTGEMVIGGGDGTIPPRSPVIDLSGSWVDAENGASYQVSVGTDGSFSGTGNVAGQPVTIQGAFQGSNANYSVMSGGMQYPGAMQFDGQCHLNWRSADGSAGGQIHVNHPPGAPCP